MCVCVFVIVWECVNVIVLVWVGVCAGVVAREKVEV